MSATPFATTDQYLKRVEGGNASGPVISDTGNCTPLGPVVAVTNKASGGSIGTAATTVDVASVITVNQTTAGQTLTVPDHTGDVTGKYVIIVNIGNQSFTMASRTVAASTGIILMWTGSAWVWVA
jgi:hypothetical protein